MAPRQPSSSPEWLPPASSRPRRQTPRTHVVKKYPRQKKNRLVQQFGESTRGRKERFSRRMNTIANKSLELKEFCNAETFYIMKRRDGNGVIRTFVLNTMESESSLDWPKGIPELLNKFMVETYPPPVTLTKELDRLEKEDVMTETESILSSTLFSSSQPQVDQGTDTSKLAGRRGSLAKVATTQDFSQLRRFTLPMSPLQVVDSVWSYLHTCM